MGADAVFRAFLQTGDPAWYLLYKAEFRAENCRTEKKKDMGSCGTGEKPRPGN